MWTDQTATKPRKVFLTEDLLGQHFLCLVFEDFIRLIKYEITKDSSALVFGSYSTLSARDAAHIDNTKMVLVVDTTGTLILYTGLLKVCKVHVTQSMQTVNSTLFKDFSCLNISCKSSAGGQSTIEENIEPLTPQRRSSLICQNKTVSNLDLKFGVMFSPVVSDKKTLTEKTMSNETTTERYSACSNVKRLSDPTHNRVTVETEAGARHRITLPDMCSSSLIHRVLSALKCILPRDLAMNFMAKWYSTRNSPGSEDFSFNSEWFLFSKTLLTMIGYDTDKLQEACLSDASYEGGMPTATKKVKVTDNGTDQDWEYLLSSQYHRENNQGITDMLRLARTGSLANEPFPTDESCFQTSAPLFSYMPAIFYSLHLLYEDMKCCTLHWDQCTLLIPCLSQLASDLRLYQYLHHYWKDYPTLCSPVGPSKHLKESDIMIIERPDYFTERVPNFHQTIIAVMKRESFDPFPYIPEVCPLIKSIMLIYYVAANDIPLHNVPIGRCLQRICSGYKPSEIIKIVPVTSDDEQAVPMHEKIMLITDALGLNSLDVNLISPGLSLLFNNSQHLCRINPPQGWIGPTYQLINRPDMVKHSQQAAILDDFIKKANRDAHSPSPQFDGFRLPNRSRKIENSMDGEEDNLDDGMNHLDWGLLRLRWPFDKRIKDVRHMLNSSTQVLVNFPPANNSVELTDNEVTEEQHKLLLAMCLRTMSLPFGRGMFTMFTQVPLITDNIDIPPLNLSGKSVVKGNVIEFTSLDVPSNMSIWPLFHNGVAAALRIQPNSQSIDTSWIQFNKPQSEHDGTTEHAGFLLGLGLTGHLRNLSLIGINEYLNKSNEPTTVGLLLGLAVARRGTCHFPTTKLLSIHLDCLLPPTCIELDIGHSTQVASILGIGLLYQGSGHRHMAETLLREIGRPPGPEMENATDRESYSLAAGLGLGLIMLGECSLYVYV